MVSVGSSKSVKYLKSFKMPKFPSNTEEEIGLVSD
jgi:hypothetical protein